MKHNQPKTIKIALTKVIENLGIGQRLKKYEILDRWHQIVGEQIAKVTHADRFDGDKLIVRVSHSAWRNELIYLKKEIIAQLNKSVNEEIVKDIIFR